MVGISRVQFLFFIKRKCFLITKAYPHTNKPPFKSEIPRYLEVVI